MKPFRHDLLAIHSVFLHDKDMLDVNKNGKLDPEEEMLEDIYAQDIADQNTNPKTGVIVLIVAAVVIILLAVLIVRNI